MILVDTFPYHGERWALAQRLQTLAACITRFYIVEARETLEGEAKRVLYTERDADILAPYQHQVHVLVVDRFPDVPSCWAEQSPQEHGCAASWWRETYARQYPVQNILRDFGTGPFVLSCGDVHEIPDPEVLSMLASTMYHHLTTPVYLELETQPEYTRYGAFVANRDALHVFTLNQMRTDLARCKFVPKGGWLLRRPTALSLG